MPTKAQREPNEFPEGLGAEGSNFRTHVITRSYKELRAEPQVCSEFALPSCARRSRPHHEVWFAGEYRKVIDEISGVVALSRAARTGRIRFEFRTQAPHERRTV